MLNWTIITNMTFENAKEVTTDRCRDWCLTEVKNAVVYQHKELIAIPVLLLLSSFASYVMFDKYDYFPWTDEKKQHILSLLLFGNFLLTISFLVFYYGRYIAGWF